MHQSCQESAGGRTPISTSRESALPRVADSSLAFVIPARRPRRPPSPVSATRVKNVCLYGVPQIQSKVYLFLVAPFYVGLAQTYLPGLVKSAQLMTWGSKCSFYLQRAIFFICRTLLMMITQTPKWRRASHSWVLCHGLGSGITRQVHYWHLPVAKAGSPLHRPQCVLIGVQEMSMYGAGTEECCKGKGVSSPQVSCCPGSPVMSPGS